MMPEAERDTVLLNNKLGSLSTFLATADAIGNKLCIAA